MRRALEQHVDDRVVGQTEARRLELFVHRLDGADDGEVRGRAAHDPRRQRAVRFELERDDEPLRRRLRDEVRDELGRTVFAVGSTERECAREQRDQVRALLLFHDRRFERRRADADTKPAISPPARIVRKRARSAGGTTRSARRPDDARLVPRAPCCATNRAKPPFSRKRSGAAAARSRESSRNGAT